LKIKRENKKGAGGGNKWKIRQSWRT
jgi:hypothetical protein